MNKITAVIAGIDKWEEFTLPFILSLQKHEPDLPIVVVDNNSVTPYPQMEGVQLIRTPYVSYSGALNIAIRAAADSDAWLILNNDMRCDGPFLNKARSLSENQVHANEIGAARGHKWFVSWSALLPRKIWDAVGEFDEKFLMCAFEDVDYSVRAVAAGFGLNQFRFPFTHFVGQTRHKTPGYKAQRLKNIDYFIEKWGYCVCYE